MRAVSLLALAAAPLAAFAAVAHAPTLKESIHVPRGWTRRARAPADHKIDLRIGLPQSDFATLERHLYEVSDPEHERYGQHLTKEEVEALVAPHPDSLAVVDEWLESFGIDLALDIDRSPAQDWVTLSIPISLAEELLSTEYYIYENADGDFIARTTSYSLPAHVHAHVDVVQPTTMFGLFKPMRTTSHLGKVEDLVPAAAGTMLASTGTTVNISCNTTITPQCIYELYGVDYKATANNGNKIGITGYLEQYFNSSDLNAFFKQYAPQALGENVTIHYINGGINNQSLPGPEAELDTQYAFGIAYPAKATFYSTGGRPPFNPDNFTGTENDNEPYQNWLDYVLAQSASTLPQVISTSYGDDEQSVPASYAQRVCAGFAQLGARGVTIFFSSGDIGVGDGNPDPATQSCQANDGSGKTKFLPTFPASCPYVTSVGGTVNFAPEAAVSFSGGGFSDYFPRPAYQSVAVPGFLKQLPKGTYAGLYNASGRGFPDLSAQSVNYWINYYGQFFPISGTSASTPAVAGLFAKLNDARIQAHQSPIGFANPLLYAGAALGRGFNDITEGNNPGCGTPGFNATKGWDPLTGLGSPNFPQLKDIVLAAGHF